MFQKVIKVREQVAADLGLNMPARSYEEHLDDFVTMLLRMAVTLSVTFAGVFIAFLSWERIVFGLVKIPLYLARLNNHIFLYYPGVCMYGSTHEENLNIEARCWTMAAILLSVPLLLAVQVLRERPDTNNFNSLK